MSWQEVRIEVAGFRFKVSGFNFLGSSESASTLNLHLKLYSLRVATDICSSHQITHEAYRGLRYPKLAITHRSALATDTPSAPSRTL